MLWKWFKRGVIITAAVAVVGGLVFGTEAISYVKSCANWTRSTVKDSVPIEFELKRAQQLLDEIMPEIHQNIRLIAQEEVEIAALKSDLERSEESFTEEELRIKALRNCLNTQKATYTFAGRDYNREELKQDLAWRFERFKEAQIVLVSKKQMLSTRENALAASMQMLDRARTQKRILASKIEALQAKHRLLKASTIGSGVQFDNSKIAQTEKLIGEIKKRLDVAEKVLAYESHFVQSVPVDAVQETELLQEIDQHFAPKETGGKEIQKTESLVAVN
ncbi:MAG: hypothetical protein JXA82_09875 [Sedimentisphaerales bacterium]|nr:hypothetical protein [Sedimentisphaerales bacterium]